MSRTPLLFLSTLVLSSTFSALAVGQERTIRLPLDPRISPDGRTVVFSWRNDIWAVGVEGRSPARRLTWHPAVDRRPIVSPDGTKVLFTSDRSGGSQVFVMPLEGGAPRQLTFDSESKTPVEFAGAEGAAFLAVRQSDRSPFRTESPRLVVIPFEREQPERVLFDAGAVTGTLSPDGTKVLFTRGRARPWRKGFQGPSASQIWLGDLAAKERPSLSRESADRPGFQNVSELWPLWSSDGKGYYFVSDPEGTFNVYHRRLGESEARRITDVGREDGSDDGVHEPSLSADGRFLLYRRRFDLHLHDLEAGKTRPLALRAGGDAVASPIERRRLSGARAVAFTEDGKQIALVAGHDVYVMDRVLREPVRVTRTPSVETGLAFDKEGKRLFFISDTGGEADIWQASCKHEKGYWWRADSFELKQVTEDRAVEADLKLSPTGKHIAYVKGNDLYVMDADGTDHRRLVKSWNAPDYDWSPDGKWLCYSMQDDEFNGEVFVLPLDGSRPAVNLSRHPDNDRGPVWSRDGKRLAWTARRAGDETDIWWVNLVKSAEEETDRDRKLKKALETMEKPARAGGSGRADPSGGARGRGGRRGGRFGPRGPGAPLGTPRRAPRATPPDPATPATAVDEGQKPKKDEKKEEKKKEPVKVVIDFDDILERVHRISIPDSRESGLLWSPDGKKLLFQATVDGERGVYAVTFPDEMKPKKLASSGLMAARWLEAGNQIVGLSAGSRGAAPTGVPFRRGPGSRRRGGSGGGMTPASMSASGKLETFGFTALEERDWRDLRRLTFDQGWRAMRDSFYDPNLNNRNWDAVRARYRDVAAELLGRSEFSLLMNMMLGELNASHMGHSGGSDPLPAAGGRDASWAPTTFHLGLRFATNTDGRGLLVESVIPKSPCDQARSKVQAGERVISIDGEAIGPRTDLHSVLTMPEARDLELVVLGPEGKERKVTVRPTRSVRGLLYDEWVEKTRAQVEKLSAGRLGYLHIRGMNTSSFHQFEEDLYHAGAGKDALIVDVRFNGGGSTADHVLTALTQPRHAITIPRDGGAGYPQDRKIYASWHKPVVVMCNEFSFSNAEILSHAIKTLGRGPVVGMRTGGGVISTGARGLVDGSRVRMPFRGWFLLGDGKDMELNGCLPHYALWNHPYGPDAQLQKAVGVLLKEVDASPSDPRAVPASFRRKK